MDKPEAIRLAEENEKLQENCISISELQKQMSSELRRLHAENVGLRGDVSEWVCMSCNCVHRHGQGSKIFNKCPVCNEVMYPSSYNLRRINALTNEIEQLRKQVEILQQIALISHHGGLVDMSESDALVAIRKLTRNAHDWKMSVADCKARLELSK